jgi:hypothetical protein
MDEFMSHQSSCISELIYRHSGFCFPLNSNFHATASFSDNHFHTESGVPAISASNQIETQTDANSIVRHESESESQFQSVSNQKQLVEAMNLSFEIVFLFKVSQFKLITCYI